MKIMCSLHESISTRMISRWILLKMRNVSDKSCRENQNTHFILNNFFKKFAIYEIKWKNTAELAGPLMTIWCMCIACWIPKATDTHS